MIDTERLQIVPLTAQRLKLLAEDIQGLEKELDCRYRAEPIEGILLDIIKHQVETVANDEANYLYHSFWLIIRRADKVVVGSTCFKGKPNGNKEVEIGYGLGKRFEHNGYMTEAVQAMCNWALEQGTVLNVIAETEPGNPKSERVLERCGFVKYKRDINTWWKLN